jgi:putative transcriptional regulator
MKEDDFSLLVASIKQAGEIRRGERKASRRRTVSVPDIPKIRGGLGLSQTEFAMLIGVSPRTLQNWEQKRREPEGPAKALLMVAARNPEMVLEALHG